jgi:hypothetical protein
VAGEGRVDRDFGGLKVADFTDHHDVGRLTEHRAEGGGEGHADVALDLHLVDAGHLVFDRIFDGDDLAVRLVDVVQRRVKGRRLAGTGRAGDEEHAVGAGHEALELGLVVGEEAQLRQAQLQALLVEDSHDDRFAVDGGEDRDTQVDVASAGAGLDASVLRDALLGEGDLGHELEARDDRRLQALGRPLHLLQHAVDAEAHAETLLQRLEVDVRGLAADGVDDERVDVADDGRVVFLDVAALRELDGHAVVAALAQDVVVRSAAADGAAAVAAGNRIFQGVRRGEAGIERKLQDAGDGIERVGVERVGNRDEQLGAVHLQGKDVPGFGLFAADEFEDFVSRGDLGDIDELHVELLAQGGGDLGPGDLAGLDELGDGQGVGVLAVGDRGGRGAGLAHVGRRHQPLVLNELDDVVVGGRHSEEIRSGRMGNRGIAPQRGEQRGK